MSRESLTEIGYDKQGYLKEVAITEAVQEASRLSNKELDKTTWKHHPTRFWIVYDSCMVGSDENVFHRDLGVVIPGYELMQPEEKETSMRDYIENELADRRGFTIGLELGGTGSNLFNDFHPGFFAESAGMALNDLRPDEIKIRDAFNNHKFIKGNMFVKEDINAVFEWLNGRKIDLIIERLGGAIENTTPHNIFALADNASVWYELLAEGGMILAQVPSIIVLLMQKLCKILNEEYGDTIEIAFAKGPREGWHFTRLIKNPGAPETLPLFNLRTTWKLLHDAI